MLSEIPSQLLYRRDFTFTEVDDIMNGSYIYRHLVIRYFDKNVYC